MKVILTLLFSFITIFAFSQKEKTVEGMHCFTQEVAGVLDSYAIDLYTYHGHLEIKYTDGYQLSISLKQKQEFIGVLEKYMAVHKKAVAEGNKSILPVGTFTPKMTSKDMKVVDTKALLTFMYAFKLSEVPRSEGNLIIKIPELKDAFNGKKASDTYIYLSNKCVEILLTTLNTIPEYP